MADKLVIREMSDEDRDDWLSMYAQLFPNGTLAGMNKEIDRILATPSRAAFCAASDEGLLGFAEYNVRAFANGCVSQPVPFLEGIWVNPVARGNGVAKALIAHVQEVARAQGFRELGSDAEMGNRDGLAMHHALGFEETERVVYFRKDL